jgi:hypothetical protein
MVCLALGIALLCTTGCDTEGGGPEDTRTYYTVVFDLDGGTVAGAASVAPQRVAAGGKASDPGVAEKDGKTFSGWFNGDMKWYFSKDTGIINADKTLKARWVPAYTITFSNEGGSPVESQTIAEDGLAAAPSGVSKTGHTVLEGWYKEDTFTTKWYFYTNLVTADITLYAKWLTDYTVTFNSNGGTTVQGTEVPSQSVPEGYRAASPGRVIKPGNSLEGWYIDPGFSGSPWDFDTGVVTGNITLNANWVPPRPEEWTAAAVPPLGGYPIYGAAYSGSKFVAVGDSGKIAYSTDGETWSPVTTSQFDTDTINGVTYGGGKFVAVGSSGKMAYSADGETWSPVTTSQFDTSTINDVTYGGGKFVAVGASGKIAYSADGETWSSVTTTQFATSAIYGVAYGGTKFVAVGASGKIAYSADGETWSQVTTTQFTSTIYGVTYGGSKFLAVGASGKMAYSADGETWIAVTTSQFGTSAIRAAAYGGGCFVAVGASGKMAQSTSGETWALITGSFSAMTIFSIAYGGGKFVAGDANGVMAYSNTLE